MSSNEKGKQKEFSELPEAEVKKIKKSDKVKLLADAIKEEYGIDVELAKNVRYKMEKVIDFLNNKYEFRYNVINTDTEYRLKPEPGKKPGEWLYFDDRDYRAIFVDMKLSNINVSDQDFKNIVYGKNVCTEYDPFKDYIMALPKWQGKFDKEKNVVVEGRDYIREFCQQVYLASEEHREYFVEGFRKWFVALVCSLITDEPSMYNINQTCLVLVGGQGKYKTTWIKNIVPEHLQLKYFYGSSFQVHNKDHEVYLAWKMIINLDEMAALNKTDIESIKSKITQDQVVVRLPYAKASVHLKRRASFTGTQNNIEFLKDETGSRRWLVVEVENIVIDSKFDIDQMYAQALDHYNNKYQYWFDGSEIQKIETHNEQFQQTNFEFEFVRKYYRVPDANELQDKNGIFFKYVTSKDLMDAMLEKHKNYNGNNTVINNISKSLRKLGFEKYSRRLPGVKNPVKMWAVVEIQNTDSMPLEYVDKRNEDVI